MGNIENNNSYENLKDLELHIIVSVKKILDKKVILILEFGLEKRVRSFFQ